MDQRLTNRAEGSARPEGGREAPALWGGSGAARCKAPGGKNDLGARFSAIWFGVLATLAFAGVLLVFAAMPSKAGGTKFDEFLGLELNAMGDAIAGVSASLAFLWLIVTALMQRSELEAQREQLAATANETQRMADAQERQYEVMDAQTRLLSEQTKIFITQMADANCEAILKTMVSFFEEGPHEISIGEFSDGLRPILHRKRRPEFNDNDRYLADVMNSLAQAFKKRVSSGFKQDFEANDVVGPLGGMLKNIAYEVPRVSDGMRARLVQLKVLQCVSAYQQAYPMDIDE